MNYLEAIATATATAPAEHLARTKARLADLYRRDSRPWIVAFSGGKDSTLLLQLVYELLLELGKQAGKTVHVVSSDTGVEAPNVSAYLARTLECIAHGAQEAGLPFQVHLVKPAPHESFWAKLIGAGYPSPTRWFRWCTTTMKIRPTRRIIEKITQHDGSVILLLGTRVDESSDRGKRIQNRQSTADGLNPHHEIPNALVATPIVDWSTEEVWDYLFSHNPPPWGGRHDFLLELYRQAAGGECPVVFDLSTPSCGGSRFGCWTCTVVKEDKSMQGFIQSGEVQFAPLNDFRDKLKRVRELQDWRSPRKKDGTAGPGPFRPERRVELFRELLALEKQVGERLISDEEIHGIQELWTREFDLSGTALKLAAEFGRRVETMDELDHPPLEQQVLDELLAAGDLEPDLIDRLLSLVLREYPDLTVWGSKAALEREIAQAIAASVERQGGTA
ncbi:MAG: DNA phosphorothioation system sulfurtransferase DndC [Rhodocyclaceae bacterium]|nr:DNA phosphorothioation system sulfurtransferase DndC [Rhodocyclaceae bacterium]